MSTTFFLHLRNRKLLTLLIQVLMQVAIFQDTDMLEAYVELQHLIKSLTSQANRLVYRLLP